MKKLKTTRIRSSFIRGILVFYILFLIPSLGWAAGKEGPAQDGWEPLSAGPVVTWTAPSIEKGKLAVQPFFFYNHTRGTFNEDGNFEKITSGDKNDQYQQSLFLEYGLTQRLEIAAQGYYEENHVRQDGVKAAAQGPSDHYLYLKYAALDESSWRPAVSGLLQLKLPTGRFQHADPDKLGTDLHGTGSFDHGYGIILTKRLKPFALHADAIYNFPGRRTIDDVKTQYGHYLNTDFAVEYFLPKGFNLVLEANGYWQGDLKQDSERIPSSDNSYMIVSPGIGWSNETIQTLLAYQRTVVGVNNDAVDSAIVTFYYEF